MYTAVAAFQLIVVAALLSVIAGRAVHLRLTKGINPFTLAGGKRGWPRLAELAFVVLMAVWLTEVVLRGVGALLSAPLSLVPAVLDPALIHGPILQTTGVLLIAAGFLLFLAALASFGASWRVGIDERRPGDLVTGGVFALSRNPIFVFLDLYFTGTFLIHGSLFFLASAVIVVVGVHYQIHQEERFLGHRYGPAYDHYCRRTPRYVGWPKT
jgi:protein-S-isoprenylcysteine O-methyltransferase Ste14